MTEEVSFQMLDFICFLIKVVTIQKVNSEKSNADGVGGRTCLMWF